MKLAYIRVAGLTSGLMIILDAISTWIFLHNKTGVEGNPMVAATMAALGVVPALILWSSIRWLAVCGIFRLSQRSRVFEIVGVLIITYILVVWSWVVFHNFFEGGVIW